MKRKIPIYPRHFLFLILLVLMLAFFGVKMLNPCYHILHLPLDDAIPFLPVFVIPYYLWYVYVPLPMIYFSYTDKKAYIRQSVLLYTGYFFCILLFLLYPTAIDFRPSAEGDGIFLMLCRVIYASDTPPANEFPSLHCFESVLIHLTTFPLGPLRNKRGLRLLSAVLMVLICLSTVFIKQHSVIDAAAGVLLGVLFALIGQIRRK